MLLLVCSTVLFLIYISILFCWREYFKENKQYLNPSFMYVWLCNESDIKGGERVSVMNSIDLKQLEEMRLILGFELKRKINDSNFVQPMPEHLY